MYSTLTTLPPKATCISWSVGLLTVTSNIIGSPNMASFLFVSVVFQKLWKLGEKRILRMLNYSSISPPKAERKENTLWIGIVKD